MMLSAFKHSSGSLVHLNFIVGINNIFDYFIMILNHQPAVPNPMKPERLGGLIQPLDNYNHYKAKIFVILSILK